VDAGYVLELVKIPSGPKVIPPVVEAAVVSAAALVGASVVVGKTIIEGRMPVDPKRFRSDGVESRIVGVGSEAGGTVWVD
jgi:hypothetical protein